MGDFTSHDNKPDAATGRFEIEADGYWIEQSSA